MQQTNRVRRNGSAKAGAHQSRNRAARKPTQTQNDLPDGDSAGDVVENWRPRLVGLSDDLSNANDMCHALLVLLENLAVHPPEGSGWAERIVNGFALLYIEAQKQIGEAEKSIEDFIDELRATAPLKTTATPAGAIRGAQ